MVSYLYCLTCPEDRPSDHTERDLFRTLQDISLSEQKSGHYAASFNYSLRISFRCGRIQQKEKVSVSVLLLHCTKMTQKESS